eukprot:6194395-Pleurochrysis_carterae.AAC.4
MGGKEGILGVTKGGRESETRWRMKERDQMTVCQALEGDKTASARARLRASTRARTRSIEQGKGERESERRR